MNTLSLKKLKKQLNKRKGSGDTEITKKCKVTKKNNTD